MSVSSREDRAGAAGPVADSELTAAFRMQELGLGFLASRCLTVAFRTGILDHLRRPATPAKIATDLDLDPVAVARVVEVLERYDIAERDGSRHRVREEFLTLCDPASDMYLGPVMEHLHRLYSSWTDELESWLVSGRIDDTAFDIEDEADHARGQWSGSITVARHLAERIDFTRFTHVADLGASAGQYSISLCRRYPGLQATLIDLQPEAAEEAMRRAHASGVRDRVTIQLGDYFDELPKVRGCDVVLMAGVISQETEEKARAVIGLAHESLVPGGLLVVVETPRDMPPGRFSALFAVHLRNFGRIYASQELADLMRQAGFRDVKIHQVCDARIFLTGSSVSRS